MRILTVGAKHVVNQALAQQTGFEVSALPIGGGVDDLPDASYRSLQYDSGSKLSLSAIRQVRHALRVVEPDVIHAFYPRPLAHTVLATTSLGLRTPIVSYRGITSLPAKWNPDEWITYLSPRVTAHACESAAVAEALVSVGVPGDRCHVIHNCLAKPLADAEKQQARCELGLADDDFVVMHVANMRPVKGTDLLLEAALACRDLPKLKVVLIGNVMDERVAERIADPRLASIVQPFGYRTDASALFAAADLFVMPSRAEALCMALIEAMGQGVCPLVSDAGGMKEAVRHGVDGEVFESENVPALADRIRHLHANRELIQQYGASAQQRAADYFSATAMGERLATMYRSLRKAA